MTWAVDLNAGGGALLIALLTGHGQRLLYIPGRTVHHASRSYRGDGKTDAKDAYIIADQARMRRDLQPLQEWDEIAVDLKILTARRYDLAADRTRAINRMRAQLLEYFPALERAFDYAVSKGALILLTGYQTPAGLRRIGPSRLATWLKNRKVRGAQAIAEAAMDAAQAQHTAVAGEITAAVVVGTLARSLLVLNEEIAAIDGQIAARFRDHRDAEVILSVPGMGPLLGALPLRPDRRPVLPHLEDLLRPQESRGQEPQAGDSRPRPPPTRRPVGPHPRPTPLHSPATAYGNHCRMTITAFGLPLDLRG